MLEGLAAALLVAAASTDLPVFHSEDPTKWGRPSQVVPPEYPAEALARGITGYVDVEGPVGPHLTLDRPVLKPDREDARVFVAPLEKVLPYWMFRSTLATIACRRTRPSARASGSRSPRASPRSASRPRRSTAGSGS